MNRKPKVGDAVRDFVYGCGITYVGEITSVTRKVVCVDLHPPRQNWFEKLFLDPPPSMLNRRIPIETFKHLDFTEGSGWELDTFL